jgi:biopolymer transport protein ExbD
MAMHSGAAADQPMMDINTTLPIDVMLVLPASDARYETVDSVLAVTKRAHVARMGFVGNEAYANDF